MNTGLCRAFQRLPRAGNVRTVAAGQRRHPRAAHLACHLLHRGKVAVGSNGEAGFHYVNAKLLKLVRQAQRSEAILLTTDSLLMERGILRDGIVPGFWLAPTLRIEEQLALVCREFGLALREPRCTKCGGELLKVDKESVRERIPPRTARWLDEYFACGGCGQLFWRGTHWRSIQARLEKVCERGASEVGGRLEPQTA